MKIEKCILSLARVNRDKPGVADPGRRFTDENSVFLFQMALVSPIYIRVKRI